jgi:hypothetical protein
MKLICNFSLSHQLVRRLRSTETSPIWVLTLSLIISFVNLQDYIFMQIFLTEEKKGHVGVCRIYFWSQSANMLFSCVNSLFVDCFSAALIIELVYITLKWSSSFDCNPSVFSSRAQCIQLVLYIRWWVAGFYLMGTHTPRSQIKFLIVKMHC